MSTPQELPEGTAEFQRAIRQGRYADAADCLGSVKLQGDPQKVLELLTWARRLVLGQRAASAAQLAALQRKSRSSHAYPAAEARPVHTWEIEG